MNNPAPDVELRERLELFKKNSGDFERNCTQVIMGRMTRLMFAVFGPGIDAEQFARLLEPTGFKFDPTAHANFVFSEIFDLLTDEQFERLPLYREIVDLHGEALFGLIDVSDAIFDYHYMNLPSQQGVYFEDEIPLEWVAGTEYAELIEARRCRRLVDEENASAGQTVSVAGIATLARIDIKTLRNILSRGDHGIQLIKSGADKGRIDVHAAREWLRSREEYLPTIATSVSQAIQDGTLADRLAEEGPFVFVPVAADGSTFNPSSKVNGRYLIGTKGDDKTFESFHQALQALQTMAEPAWKRLDKADRVRVTHATHWQRIPEKSFKQGDAA